MRPSHHDYTKNFCLFFLIQKFTRESNGKTTRYLFLLLPNEAINCNLSYLGELDTMYSAGKIFEHQPNFPSCHASTITELT